MASPDPPPRTLKLEPRLRRAALAVLLLAYAVAALAPFRFELPRRGPNPVRPLPGGGAAW